MAIPVAAALSTSFALDKVTGWIPKAMDYLEPYKPDIKNVNINYLNKNTELGLVIHVPTGKKRRIRDIELPSSQFCKIDNMMDGYFNQINLDEVVRTDGQKVYIKASRLPSSETYFIKLKGILPQKTLDDIVFVQPAQNKDRKDGDERYWLNSMIRNAESLENLWEALNVDNVTAGVDIGIERYLSTNLPPELKKGLEAMNSWAKATYSSHWGDVSKAWLNMRSVRNSKLTVEELVEMFKTLTTTEFFSEFIEIDTPYNLGEVKNKEPYQTLPQNMYAEAHTRLTLKKPTAEGYLTFKKDDYVESVKSKYNEII
ncbi:hypothetical protein [Methanobacterium formicicum]|uniref:hypothetical protein n=1 Tax=Methanobacterium formicicum TaxID=2162 RepID=UPI0024121B77|nr:hypothetical protein [Methanobacterium formicicum]MDG3547997.1 hypothetical protein [Methanobacterium formicicum]